MFAAAITFPNQHCFVICKANYTQIWTDCQGQHYVEALYFCQISFELRIYPHVKTGYISRSKQERPGLWYNKALKKFAMIHG